MALPVNYVDAQLDTSANTHRVYDIKKLSDDSVVESDVYLDEKTVYETEGSDITKDVFNGIGNAINPLIQNITEIKFVASLPADASSHPTTLYLTTS